jgi:oligoribonuclease (3'-5' exoribonuclease)
MFDDGTASQVKAIACSDNTEQRRIVEMAAGVTDHIVEKMVQGKQFVFNWMKVQTLQMKLNDVCARSR